MRSTIKIGATPAVVVLLIQLPLFAIFFFILYTISFVEIILKIANILCALVAFILHKNFIKNVAEINTKNKKINENI